MSREIMTYLKENGIEAYVVGADQLARGMGSPQSANIALIGFAASHPRFPFPHDKLRDANRTGNATEVSRGKFKDIRKRVP